MHTIMFTFFIFYLNWAFIYSLTCYDKPLCRSCKWFISSHISDDYALCKLYKNNLNINGNRMIIYDYAKHCRKNEDMCGEDGFMYDEKKNGYDIDFLEEEEILENILDEYNELNNRGCGEVNELTELEEIEDDFIRLFQRVKDLMERKV